MNSILNKDNWNVTLMPLIGKTFLIHRKGLKSFHSGRKRNEKKNEMALELTPVPLPYLTEEEFFKLMVETHYKGLAERWSKSWKKLIQNKQEIGLKEWEIV